MVELVDIVLLLAEVEFVAVILAALDVPLPSQETKATNGIPGLVELAASPSVVLNSSRSPCERNPRSTSKRYERTRHSHRCWTSSYYPQRGPVAE